MGSLRTTLKIYARRISWKKVIFLVLLIVVGLWLVDRRSVSKRKSYFEAARKKLLAEEKAGWHHHLDENQFHFSLSQLERKQGKDDNAWSASFKNVTVACVLRPGLPMDVRFAISVDDDFTALCLLDGPGATVLVERWEQEFCHAFFLELKRNTQPLEDINAMETFVSDLLLNLVHSARASSVFKPDGITGVSVTVAVTTKWQRVVAQVGCSQAVVIHRNGAAELLTSKVNRQSRNCPRSIRFMDNTIPTPEVENMQARMNLANYLVLGTPSFWISFGSPDRAVKTLLQTNSLRNHKNLKQMLNDFVLKRVKGVDSACVMIVGLKR